MRLRTAESYWLLKNGLMHSYPSLQEDLETDLVVIGAGITGALVSHSLKKAGYKVVVLDKGDVAFGSTAASTSMIQYEIDEMLIDLSEKIGKQSAAECYLAGVKSIQDLSILVKEESIDCDFQIKKSLYLAHDQKTEEKLYQEYLLRREIGIQIDWLSPEEIYKRYGIKSLSGTLSECGASVDIYQLAHGLFYKNSTDTSNPLQVYDHSPFKNVEETKDGVIVHLENGFTVKAQKAIYCSGFETTKMFKEHIAHLFETFACVSEPCKHLTEKIGDTLVWTTGNPYIYLRTTGDNRVLIGGEDSSFRLGLLAETIKKHKSHILQDKVKEMMPDLHFIEDFTWSGVFGQTKDALPYIGSSPEYKNSLFVLGFGGNGITFSVQAMDLILKCLKGENSPLLYHYRFGR